MTNWDVRAVEIVAGSRNASRANHVAAGGDDNVCETDHSQPHRAGRKAQHRSVAQRSNSLDLRPATERLAHGVLVVLVLAAVVYPAIAVPVYAQGSVRAKPSTETKAAPQALPPLAAEMRDRIAAAVVTGRIDDLQEPIDLNELPVVYAEASGGDPIAHWKSQSADGTGKDILDQLGRILALPPARLALGRDPENNGVFVWPYLAERPLDRLTAKEAADLETLMPPETATKMRATGKWTWWRLVIGADGTWHAFVKAQ